MSEDPRRLGADGDHGLAIEEARPRIKKPPLYRVVLLNDDYTPMDFVVQVLESMFNKSPTEAYRVMMHVHIQGVGVAGIFSHEVAETKVARVYESAQASGYPLRGSMEPE